MATKKINKKKDTKITQWILYVQTSENNTIITLTDVNGNKVLWWWTWLQNFKWAKQNTPYAAEVTAKEILKEWVKYWLLKVGIVFRWNWLGREWIFKAINEIASVDVEYIHEQTSIQFGGCKGIRPKRN